jgi:spore coat polysaccharide biosynthesis protein SpsF
MKKKKYNEQELFWANKFGNEYSKRKGHDPIKSLINLFSNILSNTRKINNIIEFGPNIGRNIYAIKQINSKYKFTGVEINQFACKKLEKIKNLEIVNKSILEFEGNTKYDFVLIKNVLIHINTSHLNTAYKKLYESSKKYICMIEYFNPTPTKILYRGHKNKLFKRDFCREIMKKYPKLKLINYGFVYKYDSKYPCDNINWFLLKK